MPHGGSTATLQDPQGEPCAEVFPSSSRPRSRSEPPRSAPARPARPRAEAARPIAAGVISFPLDLTAQGGFRLDPIAVTSPNDWYVQQFVYDSLLRQNADGSYSPGLAKSATVVDPQTIEVELQPNVKFSDGTPMNADAVKFSIERTMASGNVGAVPRRAAPDRVDHGQQPDQVDDRAQDPDRGPVLQPARQRRDVRGVADGGAERHPPQREAGRCRPVHCSSRTHPSGRLKFVKNPDYFQAKKIKLGGVQIVQVAGTDPQATVNALLDHQVDATSASLALDQVPPLEAGGFTIVTPSQRLVTRARALCKNKPPFDNLKVRQALNYAIDRDEINDLIYQGTSEPLWAFWTQSSKLFNPKLKDYYAHNVKKAKKLLKEAGAEDLTFDLYAGRRPRPRASRRSSRSRWAEAGITANLVNFTNIVQEFFTEQKAPGGVIAAAACRPRQGHPEPLPGSIGDFCNYDDPKLNALVAKLQELDASSKEYQQAW